VPPGYSFRVRSTLFTLWASYELTFKTSSGAEIGWEKTLEFSPESVKLTIKPQRKPPGLNVWDSPPSGPAQSASRVLSLHDAFWDARRIMDKDGKTRAQIAVGFPKEGQYSIVFDVPDSAGMSFDNAVDARREFAKRAYANANSVSMLSHISISTPTDQPADSLTFARSGRGYRRHIREEAVTRSHGQVGVGLLAFQGTDNRTLEDSSATAISDCRSGSVWPVSPPVD
jgi:hypothetical protein